MATVTVTHQKKTGRAANPGVLVDGATWDTDPHIVVGLDQVNNTSDVNKPVSTAQAAFVLANSTILGTIQGFNTIPNVSNPTTQIDIHTGGARDIANAFDMVLAAGITKSLSATWVVGTGNGGLDTGSVASSATYHVFVIGNVLTGTIDALFSTSPTNPVMPTSYTTKRRIASFMTDGSSHILNYLQTGGYFQLIAPVKQSISTPGTIALNTATMLPLGVKYRANLLVATGSSSFTTPGYAMVRDPDLGVPSVINETTGILFQPDLNTFAVDADIWSNASGQFYTGSAVGNPILFFVVRGWFDLRDSYQ